ncbi:maleylpyruvate isomerase N-terminal domain-containing protein [Micromonospora sp. WMMD1155]|uniref:maleylpyruvate isomerase N-terminal domain-containing protein n=1 Tax=Micromonospora sp. WMMD1155 TaxID=3016094 RepID=UPI00249B3BC2|nr:maleylpyruvate isomerase N-terminal domain-containing protein [Micromonospora sp. WMMD1155]WFE53333.1 maleylpyruvate isomerase N-terminal domain-containing protein [Micromonospora sp. WMMD1155]
MIRPAFLGAAEAATALLRDPMLTARWSSPSALPDFSTAGLARHLANQVTQTVTFLAAPAGESAIPVLEHFTGNAWVTSGVDSADNIDIRRRSEQTAAVTTPRELADAVDAAIAELRATVAAQSPDRIVDLGDWGLKVDDFLLTRVMELVVHTDDLAVSLGLPTPPMPATATEATIQLLSSLAAWRHGSLNVIRALARQERALTAISAL